MSLQDLRRNYTFGSLSAESIPDCPMAFFEQWWKELQSLELPEWFEINAMTLSTSSRQDGVSSRIVLLKDLRDGDEKGFCFFTNYHSAKGKQIAANPNASLNFFWPCLERQVRVTGQIVKTSVSMSDSYFAARPRSSQLGAIASPQSEVLEKSEDLQERIEQLEKEFDGQDIPRPDHWGGYRLIPSTIEFWQGRPSRLHDRFLYERSADHNSWTIKRLAP